MTAQMPSLWIRLLALIPLAVWFPFARLLAWLSWRVIPYRRHVVVANLKAAFPEWDDATRERVIRDYYRGFADMLVEVLHSARLTPAELERRVKLTNPQLIRDEVSRGKPVLLVAAHQCNWEWMLLAFSTQLGLPVDAAYKPLVDNWAEREMVKLRSRFGAPEGQPTRQAAGRQRGGAQDAQAAQPLRRAADPGATVVRRHHPAAQPAA